MTKAWIHDDALATTWDQRQALALRAQRVLQRLRNLRDIQADQADEAMVWNAIHSANERLHVLIAEKEKQITTLRRERWMEQVSTLPAACKYVNYAPFRSLQAIKYEGRDVVRISEIDGILKQFWTDVALPTGYQHEDEALAASAPWIRFYHKHHGNLSPRYVLAG